MVGGRRWSGWPLRGRRLGEASRPGPELRVLVANVTSWRASWRGLLAVEADVWCTQEARVPSEEVDGVADEARRRGLQLQPGSAEEGVHLLAFAHTAVGCHLRSPPMLGVTGAARSRLQYAAVHLGRRQALHIVHVYGYGEGGRQAEEFNASLVLTAAAWLRSLGDVPAFVVGDFTLRLAEAGVDAPLAMAGWADVLAHAGPLVHFLGYCMMSLLSH